MKALLVAALLVASPAWADGYIDTLSVLAAGGGGGGGSDPTIAGTATGDTFTGGANTSSTIQLPASIASGDLIVAWMARDGTTAASGTVDIGSGGEYTETQTEGNGGGADNTNVLVTAFKTATGSEGTSVGATWSAGENGGAHSMRVTGWSTMGSIVVTTGQSTAPDCGNVTFTAPARVFCACEHDGTTSTDFTADPSGYTLVGAGSFGQATNNSARGRVVEQRFSGGSSDNPAAFTITTSQGWACHAFAVED